MLNHPRLRIFVWLPILINIVLFIVLSNFLFSRFVDWLNWLVEWLPNWLDFLAWIVGFLSAILLFILYGYFFSMITNLFAAPFYGVLAERVAQLSTGERPSSEPIFHQIKRTIGRELNKIIYFITRLLAILLLCFIPPLGQFITIPWSSWCMSVQYCDYAADNHQVSFVELRAQLRAHLISTHGFGGMVMLGVMVPILNIFIVPAAVIGGTLYWLELERSSRKPRV